MNPARLKFHAIAIAIISVVVIAMYFVLKPAPKEGTVIVTDRYVIVERATWGKNCEASIETAIKNWRPTDTKTPRPQRVTLNNALTYVQQACNNKVACQVPVTSQAIGLDPLKTCFKRLNVQYRCFNYDRLWTKDIGEGEMLAIDCQKPQTGTASQAQ